MASKKFDIVLSAKDKVSGKLKQAGNNVSKLGDKVREANRKMKKLDSFAKSLGNSFVKAGDKMKAAGKSLTAFVTAPTVGAGLLSLKNFADFENSMLSVKTLLDDASFGTVSLQDGFKNMSQEVSKVSTAIPVDIATITKALFDTVSAGVDAGKATGFVATSAKLAVAGMTDIAVATDGMTSALNAFQLSASDADKVASKFFTAQKRGKTTIAELSSFFGQSASVAASFGLKLEDLLGAVSAATTGGIKTGQAFTGLNAVLANIAKPAKAAKEEAKRLGIEFNSTALRTKGFKKFIDELKNSSKFTTQSIEKLFGSIEAQKIMFALTGASAGAFDNILKELADDQETLNTFTQAYNEQSSSQSNQFKLFQNRLSALSRNFGSMIINTKQFNSLLSFMDRTLKKIEASPELQETIGQFAVLAAVIGPALIALGLLVSSLGKTILMFLAISKLMKIMKISFLALSLPVLKFVAIAALLATAGYLIYKNWEPLKKFLVTMWDSPIVKIITFRTMIDHVLKLPALLKSGFEVVKNFLSSLWNNPIVQASGFAKAVRLIISLAKKILPDWEKVKSFMASVWDKAKIAFDSFLNHMKNGLKLIAGLLTFGNAGAFFSSPEVPKPKPIGTGGGQLQSAVTTPSLAPDRKFAMGNVQRTVETKNAAVTVDFKNMPKGTQVTPTKNDGNLNLNLGYANT